MAGFEYGTRSAGYSKTLTTSARTSGRPPRQRTLVRLAEASCAASEKSTQHAVRRAKRRTAALRMVTTRVLRGMPAARQMKTSGGREDERDRIVGTVRRMTSGRNVDVRWGTRQLRRGGC